MPDAPASAESYLPLHPLELQVLLTLHRGTAHAYRIVGDIEERQPEWSRILPTNLYRRIRRLAEQRLIEETAPPPEDDEARPRKYFAITALGRDVAAAEVARLQELLRDAAAHGVTTGASGGAR